ncbi:MAG TPA: DUF1259 domain-containing protein, partial [Myxococcales bacterium]|nr:DUF1259 domain-containing protein [Myxococcales bacterium]
MTALLIAIVLLAAPAKSGLDTARIEQITGIKGKWNEKEGVFKVEMPRSDLAVTAAGTKMIPPLGLTAWAAFTKAGSHVVVMGDMVLTEDQVNPAMSAALDNGLQVTALHNHFFWEQPRVMFMHIGGMGDEATLANGVAKVFGALKEKFDVPSASIDPASTSLDPKKIDAVLGRSGELNKGVYKVTIGREVKMGGHTMGNAMGVNTWAAFAGSDDQAIVDGDFAMLEGELQGVLKALRKAGINIVAIHQHMTGESPRMLFLHYWGVGRTEDLARGLKSALGQT